MRKHLLLVLTVALTGCASAPLYEPVVDRAEASYAADLAECRAHAQQQLGAGGSAAAGAAVGFGLGYLLCRTMGGRNCSSTGRGTAIMGAGAGLGSGPQGERQIVRNCLLGRGHRVLN